MTCEALVIGSLVGLVLTGTALFSGKKSATERRNGKKTYPRHYYYYYYYYNY
jgi:hypothetical protein